MTVNQPSPDKVNAWTLDRVLPLLNFVLLLANTSGAVFLFWFYGKDELAYKRYEMTQKRAELEAEFKPHVKHDFSTKVYTLRPPSAETAGVFRVSFAGRITNSGKFPFRCGADAMVTAWGQFDSSKLREPIALRVNSPGEPGPLRWQSNEPEKCIGQVTNSLLHPGEEATIEADFIVVGTYDTHFAIYYSFPILKDPTNPAAGTIPWSHLELVALANAKMNDVENGKAKASK